MHLTLTNYKTALSKSHTKVDNGQSKQNKSSTPEITDSVVLSGAESDDGVKANPFRKVPGMKSRFGNSRLHFSPEKVSSLNGAAEQLVKTKKIGCDVTADHML